MAVTPFIPFIGGVINVLRELNIREEDIEAIASLLSQQASQIQDGTPSGVAPSAFGQFPAGTALAHHVSVAHDHVTEAMKEMIDGLQGYGDSVREVAADFYQTDDESAASMAQIQQASEGIVGRNDFTDPNHGGDR